MAKTIVTLNSGSFSFENAAIKVVGGLNVNDKAISNISGQVSDGDTQLGSFDAYRNGENLQFNLHPITIGVAASLAAAVGDAVAGVEAEIAE